MKYAEKLRFCPLFAGSDAREIDAMLHCLSAARREYAPKSTIFAAGSEVFELGVVLSGSVDVIQEDYWGNQKMLARLSAGQIFAESFVLAQARYLPVSVLAHQQTEVLLLDYRKILHTCTNACPHHERLIENLLAILAQKNVYLTQKMEIVTQKTIREKLLAYLSSEAKRAGNNRFAIPYDRQALADYLAVDRSALSRAIGEMRRDNVLAVDRNVFELLEKE